MKIFVAILFLCFGAVQAQTVIEGTTTNNTVTGSWNGVTVSHSSATSFTFKNNSVTSVNTGGYQLQAGDEVVASSNHNLDGETISGNKFVYNGSHAAGSEQAITHGIFTGFQSNAVIKWNYVEKTPMSIIRKANGYTDTGGGVTYNIIKNPYAVAIVCKGMGGVRIYNNTFYSNQPYYSNASTGTWRGLIDIYSNPELGGASAGIKIKNNIFYTVYQIANIKIDDAACLTGLEVDYNVYYCEAGSPTFNYLGASKNFAQWQALGYDLHSVVVNPNFNADLAPAARLNYGTNLGSSYQTGLSGNATWVVGIPPTTADQDLTWQVGARVLTTVTPPPPSVDKKKYVSTTGNNSNTGTITSPWLTWQKGFSSIAAGDTLMIRGGTYLATATAGSGDGGSINCGVYMSGKNGTSALHYKVMNYPGEVPILDGVNITATNIGKSGILLNNSSYWDVKGLEIKNFVQASTGKGATGVQIFSGHHNVITNVSVHNIGGPGFQLRVIGGEGISFINCDAYNCFDQYSSDPLGGDADGFDLGFTGYNSEYTVTLSGCRAWDVSDDGFDMFVDAGYSGKFILTNCWAFSCGWGGSNHSIVAGDGNGFKPGLDPVSSSTVKRTFKNCIGALNRMSGFNQNEAYCKQIYHNNSTYGNGDRGWNFYSGNTYNEFINNIALDGYSNVSTPGVNKNNSWNGLAATSADFVSLVGSQLSNPRKADGSLPDITFLHLKGTSQLIDKGSGVGLPYAGAAPDLGAFEYALTVPPVPPYSTLGKRIISNGKLIIK